jgi:predicted dehydrogenase
VLDRVTRSGAVSDEIGIGMVGYGFMGKAHTNAFHKLAYMAWPPPLVPRLVRIAGRNEEAVAEAARRYGFEGYATDWREVVADDRVGLFDNLGPNDLHAEPTIAAARAGKHVVCEKPLGRNADEAYDTWRQVEATGVKHLCAFNYRFVPAVRLARQMLEAGELGEVRHFRASYLQDWLTDPSFPRTWRLDADAAGSGALGDLGTHVIDLARYLVGEISAVSATMRTFVPERPGGRVTVDDAFAAVVEFDGSALGTIEATRYAHGRKNALTWEINGSEGSLAFDLERLNELQVDRQRVLVTQPDHPFMSFWWPAGHTIGWEHTFVHELHHVLTAIRGHGEIEPHGASFRDGYRASEVADAIAHSGQTGRRVELAYRG